MNTANSVECFYALLLFCYFFSEHLADCQKVYGEEMVTGDGDKCSGPGA